VVEMGLGTKEPQEMSVLELRAYLQRCRETYRTLKNNGGTVLSPKGRKMGHAALAQHIVSVDRGLAIQIRGAAAVNDGEPLPTHSTCKGTRRGQKDKVRQMLAQHGMVPGFSMDSGPGPHEE